VPEGATVQITKSRIEATQADRTVDMIARANGGRYSVDLHLRHDPNASESFAGSHVRRLEAMRRAGAGPERLADGSWTIFMRKIGYSVGLEATLSRVSDLCDVYIADGTVTLQSWHDLVSSWNLKKDNIGDFFGSLNLMKRTKTRLDVLPGLDLCALARRADPSNRILAGALLLLLMEYDGEIFLNALAGGFKEDDLVRRLTTLVHYKRDVLFKIYRAPEIQTQLARIVGIDRQATNIGGAGQAKGLSASKRTERLENSI